MAQKISTVKISLSLEQLADALRRLPPEKLEELEILLDKKFTCTILKRGKKAKEEFKKKKTLTLEELKKEF